jgi:hypothetical protein
MAQGTGSLAAALDPSGNLWKIEDAGGLRLTRYAAGGSQQSSTLLPGAITGGYWTIGFDAAGNVYALYAVAVPAIFPAGAIVYEVSPQGVLLSNRGYDGIYGQAAAADSDGESLWIAGAASGSAALWQENAAGLTLIGLSPGATAQAVLADGSGTVWVAGAGTEAALWRYDSGSGTMARYDWTNTLGGAGSSAQGMLEDTDGNIWLGGWAHTQNATVAALWKWDGTTFSLVATST